MPSVPFVHTAMTFFRFLLLQMLCFETNFRYYNDLCGGVFDLSSKVPEGHFHDRATGRCALVSTPMSKQNGKVITWNFSVDVTFDVFAFILTYKWIDDAPPAHHANSPGVRMQRGRQGDEDGSFYWATFCDGPPNSNLIEAGYYESSLNVVNSLLGTFCCPILEIAGGVKCKSNDPPNQVRPLSIQDQGGEARIGMNLEFKSTKYDCFCRTLKVVHNCHVNLGEATTERHLRAMNKLLGLGA